MDGLKYGLPVLTHKVSLRGYEKVEARGVMFSYLTKEEFAVGITKLSDLDMSRKEIQDIYLDLYQFDNGVKRMKEILSQNGIS